MTREEAKIIFLNRGYIEVDGGSYFDGNKWRESVVVISEWLKEEPRTDAISRHAVLMELGKYLCGVPFDEKGIDEVIKELPSVKPQPKTGHWIYSIYGGFHEQGDWLCSHCNYQFNYGNGHAEYCPKCGYEMSETPTEEVISEYDPRRSNRDYKMW